MKVLSNNEIQQVSGAGDLWKVYYTVQQSDVNETFIITGSLSALAALAVGAVFGHDAAVATAGFGALFTAVCTMDVQSQVGTNPYAL